MFYQLLSGGSHGQKGRVERKKKNNGVWCVATHLQTVVGRHRPVSVAGVSGGTIGGVIITSSNTRNAKGEP